MAFRAMPNGISKTRPIDANNSNENLFSISHTKIAIQQFEALESIIDPDAPVICNGQAISLASVVAVARYENAYNFW